MEGDLGKPALILMKVACSERPTGNGWMTYERRLKEQDHGDGT
jgi:hypothetical protein